MTPGGTLIVSALARDEDDDPGEGPPWALTRTEIDAIGASGLEPVRIEDIREPESRRWRAEYRRPGLPAEGSSAVELGNAEGEI